MVRIVRNEGNELVFTIFMCTMPCQHEGSVMFMSKKCSKWAEIVHALSNLGILQTTIGPMVVALKQTWFFYINTNILVKISLTWNFLSNFEHLSPAPDTTNYQNCSTHCPKGVKTPFWCTHIAIQCSKMASKICSISEDFCVLPKAGIVMAGPTTALPWCQEGTNQYPCFINVPKGHANSPYSLCEGFTGLLCVPEW